MTSQSDIKQHVEVSGWPVNTQGTTLLRPLTRIPLSLFVLGQAFFKKALDNKVAPEAQWAVFNKDEFLASGALGQTALDSKEAKPVTEVSASRSVVHQ